MARLALLLLFAPFQHLGYLRTVISNMKVLHSSILNLKNIDRIEHHRQALNCLAFKMNLDCDVAVFAEEKFDRVVKMLRIVLQDCSIETPDCRETPDRLVG